MDCSKPDGCPTPLDCSGDGCCSAEYVIENHELERPSEYRVESQVFGLPLERVLADLIKDLDRTMEAVNDINDRLKALGGR